MLLGLEVSEVPPFTKDYGDSWDQAVSLWLNHNFGMTLLQINCMQDGEATEYVGPLMVNSGLRNYPYMIAGGKSPRGDWSHAVVGSIGSDFKWHTRFDPHPDDTGIVDDKVRVLYVLIPVNPLEFADLKRADREKAEGPYPSWEELWLQQS